MRGGREVNIINTLSNKPKMAYSRDAFTRELLERLERDWRETRDTVERLERSLPYTYYKACA